MKKILILVFLLALTLLIGCQKTDTSTTKDRQTTTVSQTNSQTTIRPTTSETSTSTVTTAPTTKEESEPYRLNANYGEIAVGYSMDFYSDIDTDIDQIKWINGNPRSIKIEGNGNMVTITGIKEGEGSVFCSYKKQIEEIKISIIEPPSIDCEPMVDFLVEHRSMDDFKVLFLADIQTVDLSVLHPDDGIEFTEDTVYDMQDKYIEYAIRETKPDLILLAGDNTYGSFDPDGIWQIHLYDYLDSFDIPWSFVYGNHDNECNKGAIWQNELAKSSKNCLYKYNEKISGNSNYSIGIAKNGKLERVIYLLDSNYCRQAYYPSLNHVTTSRGIQYDQLYWYITSQNKINKEYGETIPSTILTHIPTEDYYNALLQYTSNIYESFTLDVDYPSRNGDSGTKGWPIYETQTSIHANMKEVGTDTMFVGHEHLQSISILYDGIRYTACLKSSEFDNHDKARLGGTLFNVGDNGSYSYEYIKYPYDDSDERLETIDTSIDRVAVKLYGDVSQEELVSENGVYDLSNGYGENEYVQFGEWHDYLDLMKRAGYKKLEFKVYIEDATNLDLYFIIGFRHMHIYNDKVYIYSSSWQRNGLSMPQNSCLVYDSNGNLVLDHTTFLEGSEKVLSNNKSGPLRSGEWYTFVFDLGIKCELYQPTDTFIACPQKIKIKDIYFTK